MRAEASVSTGSNMNAALWIVQFLLCLAFLGTGSMTLIRPTAEMAEGGLLFVNYFPVWFVRFIGLAEIAGAIGLVLPSLTRLQPRLTPIAAWALACLMAGALGFHIFTGRVSGSVPAVVVGVLAAFVGWGRSVRIPITVR